MTTGKTVRTVRDVTGGRWHKTTESGDGPVVTACKRTLAHITSQMTSEEFDPRHECLDCRSALDQGIS